MGGSSFGTLFRITTFGESHGEAIGVVVDGAEPNIVLDLAYIQKQLNRRRPGQSHISTPRNEEDLIEVLSGVFEGKTTGQPICCIVRNKNQDPSAYAALCNQLRPGHANMTYLAKWGIFDHRGGGRASARETIARVIGGSIAALILKKYGIESTAYVTQIGHLKANNVNTDYIECKPDGSFNPTRCPDVEKAQEMEDLILQVKEDGDSLGGVIHAEIYGVPAGIGEPVFDKLEAELSKAVMSIGAAKGVVFGSVLENLHKRGSEHVDPFYKDDGMIKTKTNNSGGILGGISNGMPITLDIFFKPPSSVKIPVETVTTNGESSQIAVHGRHDPCVLPRAVPIVEAMLNCVILDYLYKNQHLSSLKKVNSNTM